MAKKCLVTQDLISSVEWALKAPPSVVKDQPDPSLTWAKKALTDLKNKLNRVYGDMPVAAQRGIDFEKKVYDKVNTRSFEEGTPMFKEIVQRLKHHNFQEKFKKSEVIEQYDCFLYGKMDAYSFNDIIDLKTTAKFKPATYIKSFQHELTLYVKGETNFTYIVVEWLDYPKIKAVHHVPIHYSPIEMGHLEDKVKLRILTTFEILKDLNLWRTYREKYCLY